MAVPEFFQPGFGTQTWSLWGHRACSPVRRRQRIRYPLAPQATCLCSGVDPNQLIRNRSINCWRRSVWISGRKRLSTFSRRTGSIAISSRRNLSRVLFFSYRLQATPAARSRQTIQTMIALNEISASIRINLRGKRARHKFARADSSRLRISSRDSHARSTFLPMMS